MTDPPHDPTLLTRARAWIADDPDPVTRAQLAELVAAVEAGDFTARNVLADSFRGALEFGTAGLRGAVAPGPNRMNRAVVSRAAAGLAAYLTDRGGGTVVVGYDARHRSDDFARDTCQIAAGAGLTAVLLPRPLPTPLLAFAIRHLGAVAGVMVTASHNPPQDNGYKVYLGDGSQIVPPADADIAAAIDAVPSVAGIARSDAWTVLGEDVVEAYLARCAALIPPSAPRDVVVSYTPLHGVGRGLFVSAMGRCGFPSPVVVAEQAEPDPDFPTVAFPNPEEPGAMDLARTLGEAIRADVVIANDPDADRCAAAIPGPDGHYVMLRGDDVGALLGWWLVTRAELYDEPLDGVFANSIVSSSLLGRIAADAGLGYTETLTGFKWIGRLPGLTYGFEEALGYCVDPTGVRDKDGVTAALRLVECVAWLKAQGRSVADVLDGLAVRFGLHATDQLTVRVTDLSVSGAAMTRLREHPPTSWGGLPVESVDDLEQGVGGLPPTDGLRYRLAEDTRVIVRPSGTEPKLKCYLQTVVPVTDAGVAAARATAAGLIAAVKADLAVATGVT